MPKAKPSSPALVDNTHVLQDALSQAAHAFAQDILRVIGAATVAAAGNPAGPAAAPPVRTAAAARPSKTQAAAPAPSAKPAKPGRGNRRTGDWRKEAGTKPVVCPVPGCQSPGVRSKKNFCQDHAQSLSEAEREQLRLAQRQEHRAAVRAAGTAPAAALSPTPRKGPGRPRKG